MNCVDVNVLVYAMRADAPQHAEHRAWLISAAEGPRTLGLPVPVLAGALRVATDPRIWKHPSEAVEVADFLRRLAAGPSARVLGVGPRTWQLCVDLVHLISARAGDVSDALVAASALEHGATLVTADRGFRRFPGLRVRHPLDD